MPVFPGLQSAVSLTVYSEDFYTFFTESTDNWVSVLTAMPACHLVV